MPSIRRRVQHQIREAVDSVSDHIDRALESASSYSLHIKYFHREVSDIWRRDDHLKKKFEDRQERADALYAAEQAERDFIRQANASARLSRFMYSETIGDGRAYGFSNQIGEPEFMNRRLGGGA